MRRVNNIKQKIMKELTKAEEQVMQVLWNIREGFANEIMTAFPEPKPAYNTMLTVIRVLEKKGFVTHETFCKANRYKPLISKENYSKRFLNSVVERFFNNSYSNLVSAFTTREDLSLKELEELKALIQEAINEQEQQKGR